MRDSLSRIRIALLVTTVLPGIPPILQAQDAPKTGLQIRSVSAYFDYYSSVEYSTSLILPNAGSGFAASNKLLADGSGGGSAQIGWTRSGERNTSSFTYTSSIVRRFRYSQWDSWNHRFSFNTSRKITPRLTLVFSSTDDLTNQTQSLFAPTFSGTVAATPARFDDLAAAMLTSKFANAQLASIFNTAPAGESPVQNLLFGDRVLTASGRTSLSYSYSPRLSFSVSAGFDRIQHLSDNEALGNQNSYLILNTTRGTAGVSLSYSLSPHTQIGGSVTTGRVSSSLQDAYTTTALMSLGWSLARRWVLQLHGGTGFTNPVRQTFPVSTAPRPAGGGSLTFKTLSQIFMGSFDHTVSDSFGLGAASTTSASFNWRWNLNRTWWLESGISWQELQGDGFGDTTGWRATAGFGRRIGPHVILLTQYAYQAYSVPLQSSAYPQGQSAIRVSAIWTPQP